MNRAIISIEVQDYGGKEANINVSFVEMPKMPLKA